MTKLLEKALAQIRTLSKDEQDRAAEVLLALTKDRRGYTFDAKQIAGIHHAIKQADERKFASSKQLRAIFGRSL